MRKERGRDNGETGGGEGERKGEGEDNGETGLDREMGGSEGSEERKKW